MPLHSLDETHTAAVSDPSSPVPATADVLARFVFVESDDDASPHIHSESCTCQLRGC